jgi:hypothetical protein
MMNAIVETRIEPVRSAKVELSECIEAIEEVYEFMLAYAAQGLRDEHHGRGPGIRHFLRRIDAALEALPHCAAGACRAHGLQDGRSDILGVLDEDTRKAQALIRFVLSCETIGSQLIDNLNASIHLRALLTDLFVLDEALKVAAAARSAS